jgi:putative Mn2+ efflux pump MntP
VRSAGVRGLAYAAPAQGSDQVQPSLLSFEANLNLGFATSVDSLVVGFGLAMIHTNILQASGIIGVVTVSVSFAGMLFGGQLGQALGRHSKFSGGLVLLFISVRALVRASLAPIARC